MKKPTIKRLLWGLLQQSAALCIMISIAVILFNSYLTVESMNGNQTYYLSPFDTEPEFEDSQVFRDIFTTAVSDITRLVVIKGQVETNDVFDPRKPIDVTQYAGRMGNGNECRVTAVYELEDLIKWGKFGIEYTNRTMSMSEFVNYFGPAAAIENFALDEDGQLYFAGFYNEAFVPKQNKSMYYLQAETGRPEELLEQDMELLEAEMAKYSEEQLEDMAMSYIMSEVSSEISLSREDDGRYTVYYPMISCRYDTTGGERQLSLYAGNWVDYAKLQSNLVDTINSLTAAYEQYQNCNHLYLEEKSNLKYVVRMMTEDGITRTYSNVSNMQEAADIDITDYFSEYRRYLIYYPDSLEFSGNTSMTEEEISHFLSEYEYAYPETTHIWIGVDTAYSIPGDAFYNANMVFQRIVPNIGLILLGCLFLGLVWIAIGLYLSFSAGIAYDQYGEPVRYINGFDHIWTEILVLLGIVITVGVYLGAKELLHIADTVYISHGEGRTDGLAYVTEYSIFAGFGFLTSMFFNLLWYSLVRRIRYGNLWQDSFCNWVLKTVLRGFRFVVSHRNTAVSTLLPYNLFVLVNLAGVFFAMFFRDKGMRSLLLLIGIVVVDGIVGVMIFRNRAEQIDIVEGIKRIRNGEVDYKLDLEGLHGDNREMADAVNNIGEGIRRAVDTSMKDEQMKTDLITNVSHDIKTPLTSIINYVDLLKRLHIADEPAKSYIEILDSKAQRLKQLTDDLVEASKISSGTLELEMSMLNLSELMNQAIGEFSEKFEDKNLQVVFDNGCPTANIYADSRRMWRIIENLFNNICKYAMEGTRVYLEITMADGYVEASLKNISERQMNIRPDELTERFIRGDSSRTTEGSGLGLFIAKSLTQAQNGEFSIRMDGDLFKVILRFAQYQRPEEQELPKQTEEEENKEP